MISPTAASKPSASLIMSALRCCAAIWSCLILASASMRAFSSALTLKVSTACATSPISSLRPRPGRTTPKLPSASSRIEALSACIGRAMVKMEKIQVPINSNPAARPIASKILSAEDISCAAAAFSSSTLCLAKSTTLLASDSSSVAIGKVTSRAMRTASSLSFVIFETASAGSSLPAERFASILIISVRIATICWAPFA